jgi:hypothetical protein
MRRKTYSNLERICRVEVFPANSRKSIRRINTVWLSSRCSGCPESRERKDKQGTSTLHPQILSPVYLSNESSYINFENGVGFAARFSTIWLPSVSFSRAWERRAMLRNYGDWCSRNSKTSPPIFYPAYLNNEDICINSENGVRFAARFSTKRLPSVSFSRA